MTNQMYVKQIFSACFIITIFLCTSCITPVKGYTKQGMIQGMVYDFENRPIPGVEIVLNNSCKTKTDINGRFSFDKIKTGEYELSGKRKRFISWTETIAFYDPNEIHHVQMPSFEQQYIEIDESIENENYLDSLKMLEQFSEEEKQTLAWDLYLSIAQYKLAKDLHKDEILEKLERINRKIQKE